MRKYGWPIALFMVIPVVSSFSEGIAFRALGVDPNQLVGRYTLPFLVVGVSNLATAVLLGILYPWIRSEKQPSLRLVWGCALASQATSALVYLGAVFAGYGDSFVTVFGVRSLSALISLLPMLWFARQASRLGLAHAYFLAFIVGEPALPDPLDLLVDSFVYGMWSVAWVPVSALAAWLVANFDSHGHRFQWSAAAVLAGLGGLAYWGDLLLLWDPPYGPYTILFLLRYPLALILIYALRVRQYAPEVKSLPT